VEIASGTGLLTSLIAQVWPEVAAAAVVIGDGPLFAADAARVMAAGAVLVWSNALGNGACSSCPSRSWPGR
jgi:hypothetical protein